MRNLNKMLMDTLIPYGELLAVYCLMRLVRANAFAVTPFDRDVCFLLMFLAWMIMTTCSVL